MNIKKQKRRFKTKLNKVYDVLCAYTSATFPKSSLRSDSAVKATYAIMMLAIEDLHFGSQENQANAIEYFSGRQYVADCIAVLIPRDVMDKIVYDIDLYSDTIGDFIVEDEVDDFCIQG